VKDQAGNLHKVAGSKVGISETFEVLWNITDKNGVVKADGIRFPFFGNDTAQIVPSMSSSMTINPAIQLEGTKKYSIEGRDASGNRAMRDIEVIVDTTKPAPSVSFSNANPQDLRGAATVVLGAGDPNIQNMMLQVGDRKSMNVTGLSEYMLDTTEIPDGNYDLMLVATDIAGNEATIVMPIVVANNAAQIMFAIIAGLAAGGGIASVAWFVFARRGQSRSINLKY